MATETRDTTGVAGDLYADEDTSSEASNKDTSKTSFTEDGVSGPASHPATYLDTSGAQGGPGENEDEYAQGTLSETLGTQTYGSPRVDADPEYRAPSLNPPASIKDTTKIEFNLAGVVPDEVQGEMEGTFDTINRQIDFTGTDAIPMTPTDLAVEAAHLGVIVTWTASADPSGAPVTSYRIESDATGTDFAARNVTSLKVGTLVPQKTYRFRIAAVNANGTSDYTAWSDPVTPYDLGAYDDAPGGAWPQNMLNPIYRPDGSIVATGVPVIATLTGTKDAAGENVTLNWVEPTPSSGAGDTVQEQPVDHVVITEPDATTTEVAGGEGTADLTGQTVVDGSVYTVQSYDAYGREGNTLSITGAELVVA